MVPLCLKKISMAKQNARERHACLRELRLLSGLHHPSLVGFRDGWLERGKAVQAVGWVVERWLKDWLKAPFPQVQQRLTTAP